MWSIGEWVGARFMGREQPAAGWIVQEFRGADTALGFAENQFWDVVSSWTLLWNLE